MFGPAGIELLRAQLLPSNKSTSTEDSDKYGAATSPCEEICPACFLKCCKGIHRSKNVLALEPLECQKFLRNRFAGMITFDIHGPEKGEQA
jgi:hypothetical protein